MVASLSPAKLIRTVYTCGHAAEPQLPSGTSQDYETVFSCLRSSIKRFVYDLKSLVLTIAHEISHYHSLHGEFGANKSAFCCVNDSIPICSSTSNFLYVVQANGEKFCPMAKCLVSDVRTAIAVNPTVSGSLSCNRHLILKSESRFGSSADLATTEH